jgi:molybdopterin converting factor small subunit
MRSSLAEARGAEAAGATAVAVHVPRSLVALFPGCERVMRAEGRTVLEVVRALDASVPGFANRVLDAGPVIRTHLNVFVAGERAAVDTPVPPGAEVYIVPAVSGG